MAVTDTCCFVGFLNGVVAEDGIAQVEKYVILAFRSEGNLPRDFMPVLAGCARCRLDGASFEAVGCWQTSMIDMPSEARILFGPVLPPVWKRGRSWVRKAGKLFPGNHVAKLKDT